MNGPFEFNSLIVPIDFSPASEAAFDQAVSLSLGKDSVLFLLHVIDPALVDFAASHHWGSKEEISAQMRQLAEQKLDDYRERVKNRLEVDIIVSVGVPFLEILSKSEEFAVDAIVIGKIGSRGALEKLLFGSTAEKVLRGSRRPVIVLPFEQ